MHLILTHFCNKSEKTARGTTMKGGPHRGGRGEAGSGNRLPEGGGRGAERRAKPVGPLLKRFAGAAALGRGPQNAQLENRRGKRGAQGRAKSAGPFLKAPPGRRLCRRPRRFEKTRRATAPAAGTPPLPLPSPGAAPTRSYASWVPDLDAQGRIRAPCAPRLCPPGRVRSLWVSFRRDVPARPRALP